MQTRSGASVRHSFTAFPTGMALIAAEVDGRNEAMLANSFTSVSLDPPLVSMAFTHTSTTWPQLRQARELGITILAEANAALVQQLSVSGPARLDGIALDQPLGHARTLPGAAATFVVRAHQYIPAGDHELVLFDVLEHQRDVQASPLTCPMFRTSGALSSAHVRAAAECLRRRNASTTSLKCALCERKKEGEDKDCSL